MTTKRFPARVLLTVTTGRLLTKPKGERDNGISDLYELLGWMTNDSPFTHQLGRFSDECKPWLLRWFPELETGLYGLAVLDQRIAEAGMGKGNEAIEKWLSGLGLKDFYEVPKIPVDDHDKIDPVEEAKQMFGENRVIVVDPNS